MNTVPNDSIDTETLGYLWTPCLDSLFWREERTDAASGWWGHVPFAHWIIGASKPRVFVELGTHHGVSYYAFCEAVLRNKLDTRCYAVDTWKGDDQAGQYGEDVYNEFRRFHDGRYGSFSEPLRCSFDEALQYLSDASIDLLHIDGFHTYEVVRHDFQAWRPKLSERAIVLFHDTNVREGDFGVWRLWEELQEEYPCFEFLHGHGLGVLAFGRAVAPPIATLCSLVDSVRITAIRDRFSFLGEHSILVNRCWNLQNENELRQQEFATITKAADKHRLAAEERADQLVPQLSAAEKARSVAEEQAHQLVLQLNAAEKARSVAEEQVRQTNEARLASEEVARQAALQRDQMRRSLTWRAAQPFHRLAGRFPLWMRTLVYNWLVSVLQLPWRIRHRFWKSTTSLNGRQSPASVQTQAANIRPVANVPVEAPKVIVPRPIARLEGSTNLLSSGNGRRLICVSHVLPYPPRAGNEYRIHRMLTWLAGQGWEVLLLVCPLPQPIESIIDSDIAEAAAIYPNLIVCHRDGTVLHRLPDGGAILEGLRGRAPRAFGPLIGDMNDCDDSERQLNGIVRSFCPDMLVELLLHLEAKFDPEVLLAEYIFMTRPFALFRPGLLKIVDTIDVFSTKYEKVVKHGVEDSLAISPVAEAELLNRADLLIAIQAAEADELRKLAPKKQVITVPVDFTLVEHVPTLATRPVILLVASGNAMNVKGLKDFLRFAWPLVRDELPEAEFHVIGSVGKAVEPASPGVQILGHAEDLAAAYAGARVIINPAIAGTGLKIKTVEALCHLRPIVVWPSGVDGVGPEVRALCSIATNWFDFARHVIRLAGAEDGAQTLFARRDDLAKQFAPDAVYALLGAVLGPGNKRSAGFPSGGFAPNALRNP